MRLGKKDEFEEHDHEFCCDWDEERIKKMEEILKKLEERIDGLYKSLIGK